MRGQEKYMKMFDIVIALTVRKLYFIKILNWVKKVKIATLELYQKEAFF